MDRFTLTLDDLQFVGKGLRRPESVNCNARGEIFVSDSHPGVTMIAPDGTHTLFAAKLPDGVALTPNGMAPMRDGSFLLANLAEPGGVWRLYRDGRLEPFLTEVEGETLPPCNFATPDHQGRVWVSVSTRRRPRAAAYRPHIADGFVVLVPDPENVKSARIVAERVGYTNEVRVHPSGNWLYVNETMARRLSRYSLWPNGRLGPRETVAEFGKGTFPDGLVFDEEGGAWITSVISNRVIRVAPDGASHTVLEDSNPGYLDEVERAFVNGAMGRAHMDAIRSQRLRSISSLAFGGPDRKTVYLGCLLGDSLASFRSPVAGAEEPHWGW